MRKNRINVSPSFQHGMILNVEIKGDHGSLKLPMSDETREAIEKAEKIVRDWSDGYDDPERDNGRDPADDWKKP